jgi:hypothetical protein
MKTYMIISSLLYRIFRRHPSQKKAVSFSKIKNGTEIFFLQNFGSWRIKSLM